MKEFELENGELVVLQVRKHWFVFVLELLPYAIAVIFPFVLPKLSEIIVPMGQYLEFASFSSPLYSTALGIWLLVVWTSAWGAFTRYFLNVWVLTTQRIITIKQRNFFNREVAGLLLTRVQDVSTHVSGLLPSLIGYGNIKVQTAGAEIHFTIRDIPHPAIMRDLIFKYIPEEDSEITGV
ncbi:MAG: PH domain-containing protein [bacterium]|nr:PH domain-containing protein [bacterium]